MSDFSRLPKKLRPVARDQFAKALASLDFVDRKLGDPELLNTLSPQSRRFLSQCRARPVFGHGLPLASRVVREAVGAAMIETLLLSAKEERTLRSGNTRLRLVTLNPNVGLVDISSTNFPALLTTLASRRMLAADGVDAVGFMDLTLFCERRGAVETRAHIHHHTLARLDGHRHSHAKWTAAFSPMKGNVNALGGNVVNIQARGTTKDPKLTPADVAGLARYVTKETCGVNTIYQSRKGQKSEGNLTDWTGAGALRQLEFWSYVDALDACWSTGSLGGTIRTTWRRRVLDLLDYDELPSRHMFNEADRRRAWATIWGEIGNGFDAIDPRSIRAASLGKLKAAS